MDFPTIIMLVLLVVLIFFIFRNRRKRQADQANLQTKMVPGVDLMLTFGIYGKLVSINEEENVAEVEIAPGTVIKVHRQTLGRVVEPVVAESADGVVASSASEGGSTPTYSLNEDHAIPSAAPEFGERVDLTKRTTTDTDKDA
ncbi:preprotein translocase subunit YajC [Frondihabitans cladoniiphilus]|uniref:Preprotein translocase subunit YajC n=1 Tax=Frondihabitans cladoniiphilus TaxID=715785 RepID=A0ABP8VPN2_9MICO